ncbi:MULTISPECIES: hypothetical protein [Paraburkholderia]|uniref:hypothetical protein n=1 Tax=Paraburkholderia caledonica TaxID=134536 RepID=UPI0038BD09BC
MVHIAAMGMAVMVTVSHRHIMRVTVRERLISVFMVRRRDFIPEMRRPAFYGDGRERLNRKAQYQQHHDEEFAPIGHGPEV